MYKIFLIILLTLFYHKSYADKNMKIGSLGKSEEVDRTIKVIMYDNYFKLNALGGINARDHV